MSDLNIRNRHRVRKKVGRDLVDKLNNAFSTELLIDHSNIDSATVDDLEIYIIDNDILVIVFDTEPFLTIRGIQHYRPANKFVTVDMGAIKFITNGADVMAPGVIDADENIENGDLVWVRDEENRQPLAIGRSLMAGPEMVKMNNDKAVSLLHYIGDKLWKLQI